MTKKYLIIGDGESPHIEKWVSELGKYFEIYLVSSTDVNPGIRKTLPEERIYTIKLKRSDSGGNLNVYKMIFPLKRIINRVKPDYVNAHYVTSHGFVAALVRKISSYKFPLIQSAWGTDILVTPFRNRILKNITRFALKQSFLATADSVKVADIIHDLAGTKTMTFPFGLQEMPEVSFNEKDPHLYFSNRTLNANSNIDRVLHFFAKIHDENKNARLVIAHDGPMKNSLQALSEELGICKEVKFAGFISPKDQNDLYLKSQFYFSVLTSDALSVSLLEAMGHGCIPIVSDLPDNRDWVTDGENGIILKPGTRQDVITDIQKKSKDIFEENRALILKGAIFPQAIENYYRKLIELN